MRCGFIGLGVMGEPMCRNLAMKSGADVIGYDLAPAPLERLGVQGVTAAATVAAVARASDVIFLSLPSGDELEAVCGGADGLLAQARAGQIVVDLGTSPVGLTRALAARFAAKAVGYADAPVARTRQAAEDGTLSVMVGASAGGVRGDPSAPRVLCHRHHPLRRRRRGPDRQDHEQHDPYRNGGRAGRGAGGRAPRRCRRSGSVRDADQGFRRQLRAAQPRPQGDTPERFPARAFSARLRAQGPGYALQLAQAAGVELARRRGRGETARQNAAAAGAGDLYWPVVARTIDRSRR